MPPLLDRTLSFFVDNFPDARTLAVGVPAGLAWAGLWLFLAGLMKQRLGLRTGYSRKTFHFATFCSVALIQYLWGLPALCLFGGMTSLVVLYAIIRGDGHLLYEALARQKDAPRRTYFIVAPYFATLLGGLAGNILWPGAAVVGYLCTGLGDAVGEPVGVRWGRHRYRVPSVGGVPAHRSLEGSAAVFTACVLAVLLAVHLSPALSLGGPWPLKVLAVALGGALVEAASPHGWDNATMQLAPTLMASYLLGTPA